MRYYDNNSTTKNKVKEHFVDQPHMYSAWKWLSYDIEEVYYSNRLHCFRRIRTTNEMRQLPDKDTTIEYNIRVRGRRGMRQLPSAWDDIWYRDVDTKSWKHKTKRKKQWKYE